MQRNLRKAVVVGLSPEVIFRVEALFVFDSDSGSILSLSKVKPVKSYTRNHNQDIKVLNIFLTFVVNSAIAMETGIVNMPVS